MPITFSFDIETASLQDPNDRSRIQAAFTRLGWEHIGGSTWRYPRLGADEHPSEDWFNHVVPALMYFRAIVEHAGARVTKFTLDAHSEAGFRDATTAVAVGRPIQRGGDLALYAAEMPVLSEERLKKFISDAAASLA